MEVKQQTKADKTDNHNPRIPGRANRINLPVSTRQFHCGNINLDGSSCASTVHQALLDQSPILPQSVGAFRMPTLRLSHG